MTHTQLSPLYICEQLNKILYNVILLHFIVDGNDERGVLQSVLNSLSWMLSLAPNKSVRIFCQIYLMKGWIVYQMCMLPSLALFLFKVLLFLYNLEFLLDWCLRRDIYATYKTAFMHRKTKHLLEKCCWDSEYQQQLPWNHSVSVHQWWENCWFVLRSVISICSWFNDFFPLLTFSFYTSFKNKPLGSLLLQACSIMEIRISLFKPASWERSFTAPAGPMSVNRPTQSQIITWNVSFKVHSVHFLRHSAGTKLSVSFLAPRAAVTEPVLLQRGQN